ncbi:MAG TPA: hypothetical protein PKK69_05855 [Ferruginibacter sp.]|nr:hypothetical protein [Ferruginibacter sp.]
MRRILLVFAGFLTLMIFNACQKELNFDPVDGLSVGTLKSDSAFDCLPSSVSGVFQVDSALGNGNYLDVTVDVSVTGTYTILSDTINGFSFKGEGTFGNTGIQTVRLYGTGRPILDGPTTFIVRYGQSFCFIDVNVVPPNLVPAVYTFGGAGGFCTGAVLDGLYMESLAMNTSNTVEVSVNVSVAGSYQITTNTVNGISFSGSGIFQSVGAQPVLLTATGTPTNSGTFNYAVSGSSSSCSFSITFDSAAPPAVYTLEGAPGNCTAVLLSGSYVAGVPTSANNTATLNAIVTNAGFYSISTTTVNGVTFSANGVFTQTGTQIVTLTASGTPTATGAFQYPVTGNSSTCPFTVDFTNPPSNFINCRIDGVYSTFNTNATASLATVAGNSVLSIQGASGIASTPSMLLSVSKVGGGTISNSVYTVNQLALGYMISCTYGESAASFFNAASSLTNQNQVPAFNIVITSISATRVSGTFAGPVKDNGGQGPAIRTITQGAFDVPLQ